MDTSEIRRILAMEDCLDQEMNRLKTPEEQQLHLSKELKISTLANGKFVHVVKKDHNHQHNSISDCSKRCLLMQEVGRIDVYEHFPTSSSCRAEGPFSVGCANISSDFSLLCCADNHRNIYVFTNISTRGCYQKWVLLGQINANITLQKMPLKRIQFSKVNNFQHLVMTGFNGNVYVSSLEYCIDIDMDGQFCTISTPVQLIKNSTFITDTVLTENGEVVVTSHRDCKVQFSSFPLGMHIRSLTGSHEDPVQYINLLKNDTILVSISEKGNIVIWEWTPRIDDWVQFGKIVRVHDRSPNPFIRGLSVMDNSPGPGKVVQLAVQHMNGLGPVFLIRLESEDMQGGEEESDLCSSSLSLCSEFHLEYHILGGNLHARLHHINNDLIYELKIYPASHY